MIVNSSFDQTHSSKKQLYTCTWGWEQIQFAKCVVPSWFMIMDEVEKQGNYKCNTVSSEPCRIHVCCLRCPFWNSWYYLWKACNFDGRIFLCLIPFPILLLDGVKLLVKVFKRKYTALYNFICIFKVLLFLTYDIMWKCWWLILSLLYFKRHDDVKVIVYWVLAVKPPSVHFVGVFFSFIMRDVFIICIFLL
jgi:hypothetical protein